MEEYLVHGSKWTLISEKIKEKNVFSVKNRFFQLIKKFNGAKMHEALEKTKELESNSDKKKPKPNPIYGNVNNISKTLENHQINLSPFIFQSYIFCNKISNFSFFRSKHGL